MSVAAPPTSAPSVNTDSTLEILAQHKIPFEFNPFVDSLLKQIKKIGEEVREQARHPLYLNVVDQLIPAIENEIMNIDPMALTLEEREECIAGIVNLQADLQKMHEEVDNCRTGGISVSTDIVVPESGQWEYVFHVNTPGKVSKDKGLRVLEQKPLRAQNTVINLRNVRCQPGTHSFKDDSSCLTYVAEIRARPEDFEKGMELARENYYGILNCTARYIYRRALSMAFALNILNSRQSIQLGGGGTSMKSLDMNAELHRRKNGV